MEKEIEKRIRKVDLAIQRAIYSELKNPHLVLDFLERKRAILERTQRKLKRINERHLVNFTL